MEIRNKPGWINHSEFLTSCLRQLSIWSPGQCFEGGGRGTPAAVVGAEVAAGVQRQGARVFLFFSYWILFENWTFVFFFVFFCGFDLFSFLTINIWDLKQGERISKSDQPRPSVNATCCGRIPCAWRVANRKMFHGYPWLKGNGSSWSRSLLRCNLWRPGPKWSSGASGKTWKKHKFSSRFCWSFGAYAIKLI